MKTMILYTIWLRPCKMSKKQRNVLKKYLLKAMCFTTDEPQPWTDSRDCYFEYLIIHFDYLIIPFDYLIIGQNIANF